METLSSDVLGIVEEDLTELTDPALLNQFRLAQHYADHLEDEAERMAALLQVKTLRDEIDRRFPLSTTHCVEEVRGQLHAVTKGRSTQG